MTELFETIFSAGSFDVVMNIGIIVAKIVVVLVFVMLFVAYAPYFERKIIGHMQVRVGPMRVGFHGILQPIADGIKLFFKEDVIPDQADKTIFYLSPVISVLTALSSIAVIPIFHGFVIANINIGILYILALSSLGAYGMILSGWASNSKYAFLGSLRSSAQVVSYEIAMGLSLVGVIMMAGSMNLVDIVEAQQKAGWFILPQFLGFFIFFIAAIAETNRAPFDLPEAESELVAGYFTEYSGIRFALFFLAEYVGMMLMAALGAICFLGGWNGPEIPYLSSIINPIVYKFIPSEVIQLFWLLAKVFGSLFMYYWIRATLPRYRYDQLMALGWKLMIPLALFNIVLTGTVKTLLN